MTGGTYVQIQSPSDILKESSSDVLARVLVVSGRRRMNPKLRPRDARTKTLTDRSEEHPEPAEIVLAGLKRTRRLQLLAERFQDRRKRCLAGEVEVTERQIIFKLSFLRPGDSFIRGLKRFLYLRSTNVIAEHDVIGLAAQ